MVGVRLEGVTKRFGAVVAADRVTLAVGKGDLFFLLGPSGCGKTTLLRIVAGFEQPDSGTVHFDDRDMADVPPHRRNTGMVFQNYALWPHLTVADNVAYGLAVRRVGRRERRSRVAEALEMVHMQGYEKRLPTQLSGGQQQRVALARALVVRPDAILLDEPLSNLDAKLRLEMRAEITRIHAATGITTIYVTHDQKEALSVAQRIAVIRDGRVEQVGSPREVYRSPVSRFVAGFVGQANELAGTAEAAGPGLVRVTTAVGQVTAACEQAVTGQVTCCVRPEACTVLAGARPEGENCLPARLARRTYLGEVEQYDLVVGADLPWTATALNPRESLEPGAGVVHVCFASDDVMVFPA